MNEPQRPCGLSVATNDLLTFFFGDVMNQVQMAAKLYDTRDTLRRLFGEAKYAEKIAEYRPYLEKEAVLHGGDVLPAMIAMIGRLQDSGKDVGIACELLMATAVEMIEG